MLKVSVCIPTFKPGSYVFNSLSSLENQTLSKDSFKVYIALNGSDLSYKHYIEDILKKFSFDFELFFLDKPGVSNARNYLIDHSNEEYVVFLDDDDILSANYLDELLKVSSEVVVGICNVYNFSKNLNELSDNYIGLCFEKLSNTSYSKIKSRKYYSSPWAKMIHRNIIANTRFDTKLSIGEDSLFMAKISCRVKAMRKTSSSACYYVNERIGSVTRNKIDKKNELKRILYLLKEYNKMLFSFRYDFLFIMTRIAATFRHILRLFK